MQQFANCSTSVLRGYQLQNTGAEYRCFSNWRKLYATGFWALSHLFCVGCLTLGHGSGQAVYALCDLNFWVSVPTGRLHKVWAYPVLSVCCMSSASCLLTIGVPTPFGGVCTDNVFERGSLYTLLSVQHPHKHHNATSFTKWSATTGQESGTLSQSSVRFGCYCWQEGG